MTSKHKLSPLWLKASVIGSIWASIEIIAGSFLHNLHIPFSGTFLASIGVFLLISFMQLWKEHGIIIRAGIICALMKSISPSAFIFGPMIGIFLEAFLLELGIWIFGRNYFGFAIGGALAVCSTLFQKIANYLIIYGFDIVSIVSAFYKYLVKLMNLPTMSPIYLIICAFAFYALLGMIAATLGYFAGKKQLINKSLPNIEPSIDTVTKDNLRVEPTNQSQYPFLAIALILCGMVSSLFMINVGFMIAAIITGSAFVFIAFLKYKSAFRRFKKPGMWIQFLIITVIAAISWEWLKTENFYSTEGLVIALKINFRAIVMILGFAAISVELRSPVIRILLTRHGFASVYSALNLSFAALPSVVSALPKSSELHKERKNMVSRIFSQAQNLLSQFENHNHANDHIFIINGKVHEGKTTFARQVAENLKNSGLKISGFLSVGTFEENQRYSFEIENLTNGEKKLLCSRKENNEWEKFGSFYFNPEAIAYGNLLIQSAIRDEILFIDEIGKLELVEKGGWYSGIKSSVLNHDLIQIWIVRKDFIPLIVENYNINENNIFDINSISAKDFSNKLINLKKKSNLRLQIH